MVHLLNTVLMHAGVMNIILKVQTVDLLLEVVLTSEGEMIEEV
jgi:hypothetical protein